MYIRNNIMAMTAHRNLANHFAMIARSIERLSSGYRINRAADDAAGLAISEKMRAQIRGLSMASKNSQDAISLIQTAEGALQSSHDILQRMRELAVQAASDTNEGSIDRAALNKEYQHLLEELDDIAGKTRYNDRALLDGSLSHFVVQTGANQGDELRFGIGAMSAYALGLTGTGLASREAASDAISATDQAIKQVASQRADLGALHNRLEYKISNLDRMAENLQAAESRIRDVDIAKELMTLTRHQLLAQVSMAMLAQANARQQMVLDVLFGLGPRRPRRGIWF